LRNLQYAPLDAWAAFIRDLPGTLVSAQYDGHADELAALQTLSGRAVLAPPQLDQKQEIDRTAALIAGLDAVVTAPTSVAWIAAGLGVPTCKILYNNSWTSFGRDYEPFAPSARCMMPKQAGDWADAFAKAREALAVI
jgi:ADP-heptose:LPS heptosyltransferase